jgi:hypothetical protein
VGFWLDGWAGDNAGKVVGREPNTLLVAVTTTDYTLPPGGLFKKGYLDGVPYYYECWVDCLTPNARPAIATNVAFLGTVYAIEVMEMDWGDGKDPWAPGVHLFSVGLGEEGTESATLATAVIDDNLLPRLAPKQLEVVGPALLGMFRESRTAAGRRRGWQAPPDPDRIAAQEPPEPDRPGEADRSARRISGAVTALIEAVERQNKMQQLLIEELQRTR